MSFIVQKYGGTSVGNPSAFAMSPFVSPRPTRPGIAWSWCVRHVGRDRQPHQAGREVNPEATAREVDMLLSTGEQQTIALLALALHGVGVPAVSLTGAQAGIVTDRLHTKAKIINITPKKVHEHLDTGMWSLWRDSRARTKMGTSPRWDGAART